MEMIVNGITITMIVGGVFFTFMGALGIVRFPDFYTRMHAAGKCDTLGALLIVCGIAVYLGFSLSAIKVVAIAVFIFLTSPTATHAIAKAAFRNKVPHWTKEEKR